MGYMQYSETFDVLDATPEELEADAHKIMTSLLELEGGVDGVSDSAVSIDTDLMRIEIEFGMDISEGMSIRQSRIVMHSVARTVIHAAGGFTTSWDGKHAKSPARLEFIDA